MTNIKYVDQLLDLDDAEFVQAAYQALLGRSVDPEGLNHYLARLRAGTDKQLVIVQLARSPEAKQRPPKIKGLKDLVTVHTRAEHWFWRIFYRNRRLEWQLKRLAHDLNRVARQATGPRDLPALPLPTTGHTATPGSPSIADTSKLTPRARQIFRYMQTSANRNDTGRSA